MCSIFDRQQIQQDRGSKWPIFRHHQNNHSYKGPLFQLLNLDCTVSSSEPLPRLLIDFFQRFNNTCRIWRQRNLLFWASNKDRVLRIANNYIFDRIRGRHGSLHDIGHKLGSIVLNCGCCGDTEVGSVLISEPCLLCEFNSQQIALLFRLERPRIEAHQWVQQILREHVPRIDPFTRTALNFHIAGFVAGCYETPGDFIEGVRQIVLTSIHFCQNFDFAPEIRSIVDRNQFILWAEGVEFALLRPYWQEARPPRDPLLNTWSVGDSLLRNYPNRLDNGRPGTVHISTRVPLFARSWQLYLPPSESVVLDLRRDTHDAWYCQSRNNPYLDFERHPIESWFWVDSDEFESSDESDADEETD